MEPQGNELNYVPARGQGLDIGGLFQSVQQPYE